MARVYGTRCRLGILVPAPNTVMEPEFNELAPDGVSVHATRLTVDGDPGRPETIIRMAAGTEDAARKLSFASDVIAYGCTAGSFSKGAGWDDQLVSRITEASGRPATTTATALVKAARALGAARLSIATPYTEESNSLMAGFFVENGFRVLAIRGLNMYKAGDPAGVTGSVLRDLVKQAWSPEAECIILSCTDMPTIACIEALESDYGVPVVSSNQATFWHSLQLVGIRANMRGYGRLLSRP